MKAILAGLVVAMLVGSVVSAQEGDRTKRVYPALKAVNRAQNTVRVVIYAEGWPAVYGYHCDVTFDDTALAIERCRVLGTEWDFLGCTHEGSRDISLQFLFPRPEVDVLSAEPNEVQWIAWGADPAVNMSQATPLCRLIFTILDPFEEAAMIAVDHVSIGLPGAVKDTIYVNLR
jgi:hypothetical protein